MDEKVAVLPPPTSLPVGLTAPSLNRLTTKWVPLKSLSPFFTSGSTITYDEQHQVIFALDSGAINIIDIATSTIIERIAVPGDLIHVYSVTEDKSIVVAACRSTLLRTWSLNWNAWSQLKAVNRFPPPFILKDDDDNEDNNTRETLVKTMPLRSWKGPKLPIVSLCLTKSSTPLLAAAGVSDGTVAVYDIQKGYCTHAFHDHQTRVELVKFHPSTDRLILFTASDAGLLYIHDLYRHMTIGILKDHLSTVTDLAFIQLADASGTNTSLGAATSIARDKVINIWDLQSLDSELSKRFLLFANKIPLDTHDLSEISNIRAGQPLTAIEHRATQLLNGDAAVKNNASNGKRARVSNHFTTLSDSIWKQAFSNLTPILLRPIQQLATHEEFLESVVCVSTRLFKNCFIKDTQGTKLLREKCPWVIITGGKRGCPIIWDPSTRQQLAVLSAPNTGRGAVISLIQQRSSKGYPILISVVEDRSIVFWDLRSCTVDRVLLGNATELIHCQFVPVPAAHHEVLPACQDGIEEVYKKQPSQSRKEKKSCRNSNNHDTDNTSGNSDTEVGMGDGLLSMKTSRPSGFHMPYRKTLVLRSDADCTLVEMSQERTTASLLQGHADSTLTGDVSSDGCWIVTGSKDHTIHIWSARLEKLVAVLRGHTAAVVNVQTNKKLSKTIQCSCMYKGLGTTAQALPMETTSGGFFLVSVCLESVLKLWTVDRNHLRKACDAYSGAQGHETILTSCPPVHTSSSVLEINSSTASVIAHDKEVNALAIAPNDKVVATGSSDKTIKLWSLPELSYLGIFKGHLRPVWTLKFSPTEKVLASGSADKSIKLWSLRDYSCLKTFQGHNNSILSLDFLTLGSQVVSAGADGLIKVWNIRTSDCCSTLDSHCSKKIWSIAADPSGSLLVSGGEDNQLIVWRDDTENLEQTASRQQQEEASQILAIEALSREGKTLKALTLSVRHRRPYKTRALLEKSFEQCVFDQSDVADLNSAQEGIAKLLSEKRQAERIGLVTPAELHDWTASLTNEELSVLFEFVVKWNTNGQTSLLANHVMDVILKSVSTSRLLAIEGFMNLSKSFLAYAPRHTARLGALLQRTFVLDLILFSNGVKSIQDVPDLPLREPELGVETRNNYANQPQQDATSALSITDACDIIFG